MAVAMQKSTKDYSIYCGDCIKVLPDIKDNSIGFSIFSPPFSSLYCYSDDDADLSNNSYAVFFNHFGYLVEQLGRVMMPGRIVAVHCMDLPTHKSNGEEIGILDFPGDVIRCFEKFGFIQHTPRITIWKDPLIAAVRTKAIGLAHKQIVKDSAFCRTVIPDYVIAFRKKGTNPVPVANPDALTEYAGSRSIPKKFDSFIGHKHAKTNKRSHWIWQQYASPVWFDIRQTNVLPYREGRSEEDERHICPLQLDVIERCMTLWTKKDDIVLTPFMGIGSEIYVAVKNGRKGIGIELKQSYYKQAAKNIAAAKEESLSIFNNASKRERI
jgi:DNA modification methylase